MRLGFMSGIATPDPVSVKCELAQRAVLGAAQFLAVAERLDDGSRGLQPTELQPTDEGFREAGVAERRLSQAPRIVQASLRDAHSTLRPPWAEAHGYRHFLATRGSA